MNIASIERLSREELVSSLLEVSRQLEWFKKQVFGQKSERRVESADQLSLGELLKKRPEEEEAPPPKETVIYERAKRQKGKLPGVVDEQGLSFDSTTPIKTIKIPNPEIAGLVEGEDYEVLSKKTSSTLAQKPASYVVLRYEQNVIKLKVNGALTTSTIKPEGVFAGSYADVSLIANLLIDKNQYHLPLYRQHQRIQACGVKIARSTLTNFFHRAADLLEPIYRAQKHSIRESKIVTMDETPVKAGHNKGQRKLNSGYFWGVYGDKDEVNFHYARSRASPTIEEVLGGGFSGILQTDGYEAYSKYCNKYSTVVHAECWSHTRRTFLKAEQSHPKLVETAIKYIGELYQIEAEIKNFDNPKKIIARGEKTKFVIDQFFEWLKSTFKTHSLLPSDEFTKAANYGPVAKSQCYKYVECGTANSKTLEG